MQPYQRSVPKAAFSSSPLHVNSPSNGAGGARGPAQAGARKHPAARPNASTVPTHSAFAQSNQPQSGSPYPYGAAPTSMWSSGDQSAKAPARHGVLYGAIDSLQAAVRTLSEAENAHADARTAHGGPGAPLTPHDTSRSGGAGLTPEEVWQQIPSGGEAVWRAPQPKQSLRLRVARLQEALSQAATGLQKAQEACTGAPQEHLGTSGLSSSAPATALRHECATLEAESKELAEEKVFLDARLEEVKQELARAKAALQPPTVEPRVQSRADGRGRLSSAVTAAGNSPASFGDVSEMAVVLRLLACLKDVAINNRSVILPADPSKWTREQQVVAYFLDEVEASQARLDGGY